MKKASHLNANKTKRNTNLEKNFVSSVLFGKRVQRAKRKRERGEGNIETTSLLHLVKLCTDRH